MFQPWTRRRTTSTPPDSGPPLMRLCAATIFVALLVPACGGHNKTENRIRPIEARLTIVPFPGTPDPAVFLEGTAAMGDLVTMDVKLHNGTGTPIDFDAYTLEFHFDPLLVNVSDVFNVNPAVLGQCCFPNSPTCSSCDPLCSVNANADTTGVLLLGVAALPGCPTASVTGDTTLLTLGFTAATTIPGPPVPPNDPNAAPGRISLISGAGHGDCEILNGVGVVDLGIPCVDGSAYITASR